MTRTHELMRFTPELAPDFRMSGDESPQVRQIKHGLVAPLMELRQDLRTKRDRTGREGTFVRADGEAQLNDLAILYSQAYKKFEWFRQAWQSEDTEMIKRVGGDEFDRFVSFYDEILDQYNKGATVADLIFETEVGMWQQQADSPEDEKLSDDDLLFKYEVFKSAVATVLLEGLEDR